MASFRSEGIAAQLDVFDKLASHAERNCQAAVKAGAEVLTQRLAEAAPEDTGALKASIKAGAVKYNPGDGYHSEVGPKGNHPKTGEPLAKIGNVLEYGRSNMPARPWFKPTLERAEGEVVQAMADAFKAAEEGG